MTRTQTRAVIAAATMLAATTLGDGTAGATADSHAGVGAAPAETWARVPDVVNASVEYPLIVCNSPTSPTHCLTRPG
jgi:hypothetical protein